MSDEKSLQVVCSLIVDCEHRTAPSAIPGKEYAYSIGTPNIRNGRIIYSTAKRVDEETYSAWTARATPRRGDLVFAREAPVGEVGYVDGTERVCLGQRTVLLRPNPNIVQSRYLHFKLLSPALQERIQSKAGGSTVSHLNVKDIRALDLGETPSLSEQEGIAVLLGALDDKIAVNDRIAATSLQLTETMLEAALGDDDEKASTRLSDIADINRTKVVPKPGATLNYIDISSVSVDKVNEIRRIPWDDAPGRARRKISQGDSIWSTVRPNRCSRALILDGDRELVGSTGFAVLSPRTVGAAYLYETTRRREFVQYLVSVAEGSAYPAVRAERFGEAMVPLLSERYLAKFESAAMPIHRQIHSLRRESETLAELRDTLLPKLMSGEIRIRDAEKAVEEVT